ncbi:hypothetical protein BCH308197_0339 [Bacillus cereus H3081.97]|nr:hypothetical protein BCH308197_0339 [Bacillus cereus H3081.97]
MYGMRKVTIDKKTPYFNDGVNPENETKKNTSLNRKYQL